MRDLRNGCVQYPSNWSAEIAFSVIKIRFLGRKKRKRRPMFTQT